MRLLRDKNRYLALPYSSQKSAVLKSMVWADGIVVIPENVDEIREGQEVEVQLLD